MNTGTILTGEMIKMPCKLCQYRHEKLKKPLNYCGKCPEVDGVRNENEIETD